MTYTHSAPCLSKRLAAIALAAPFFLFFLLFSSLSYAFEPVKISRDDTALDLTATTDIYANQGEAFQVSTAPGPDGIRRRIEVRASSTDHQGDWAVFALANVSEEQAGARYRRTTFPSGEFQAVLARSRLAAHHRDHAERRLCA